MADVADGQRWRNLELLAEHGVPTFAEDAVEVAPREDSGDAGQCTGGIDVETGDCAAGRCRCGRNAAWQHAWHRDVIDILTVAREQALVLFAGDRLSDVAAPPCPRRVRKRALPSCSS